MAHDKIANKDSKNMNNAARKATKKYHQDFYKKHNLFNQGSWLENPKPEVIEVIDKFLINNKNITILDLGSGVGRNAIPIAQKLKNNNCEIVCVDYLQIAIDKLKKYTASLELTDIIKGYISPVEDFFIEKNKYNYIIAHSVLSHVNNRKSFDTVIQNIVNGTKINGFNYLNIVTNLRESDGETGKSLPPESEVELEYENTKQFIENKYKDWKIHKLEKKPYQEEYFKNNKNIVWQADYLLLVAEKVE